MGKRISQLKLCFEAVYVYFEVSSMSLQTFLKQIKCKKITLRFLMMAIPTHWRVLFFKQKNLIANCQLYEYLDYCFFLNFSLLKIFILLYPSDSCRTREILLNKTN